MKWRRKRIRSHNSLIYQALKYLGIAYKETTDCEADDWISAYAKQYGKENEVIISSFDSDFFQLISDKVSVFRYHGDASVLCTPEYVREKYGIGPERYAEFKSLTGDKADNIPGADKVGVKTAAALLNEFGTLENLLQNAENIQKLSVRKSIIENRERLIRNLQLIKLDGSHTVPFTPEEMEYTDNKITTTEVLRGIGLK